MNTREFGKFFRLSPDQIKRKCREARDHDGSFELPGRGWYRVEKTGKGATSPLDITPDDTRESSADFVLEAGDDPFADLIHLSQEELDRRKTIADIQRIRSQTAEGKAEAEAEFIAEASRIAAETFLPLRRFLEGLELSADQIAELEQLQKDTLQNIKNELKTRKKRT